MNRLKSKGITVLVLLSALLISCSRVRRPVPGETENSGKGSDTAMTFTVTDGKYGAKGDGSADCTDAFLAASADAAESGGAVCIPAGTYRVGGKVEFPGNITLKFGRGAVIETAKGGAVTLDCRIEAAAMQIFGGEGTFSGNSRSTGYPEWFGGAADGTDSSAAMQKAVDIFPEVRLTAGSGAYRLGGIRITKPTAINGVGVLRVGITAKKDMNLFEIASGSVYFSNLWVDGK